MKSKIDTSSAQTLLDSWRAVKREYKNPIFLCHPKIYLTVVKSHDKDHKYFYDPPTGKLFGYPIHQTNEEGMGLYVVENSYRE